MSYCTVLVKISEENIKEYLSQFYEEDELESIDLQDNATEAIKGILDNEFSDFYVLDENSIMANKTIINGVDVRKCRFYFGMGACGAGKNHESSCMYDKNCAFKQSTHKDDRIKELEEENKYLKDFRKYNSTCQDCYEDGFNVGMRGNKELRKLQQKLSKIAKIASQVFSPVDLEQEERELMVRKIEEIAKGN